MKTVYSVHFCGAVMLNEVSIQVKEVVGASLKWCVEE